MTVIADKKVTVKRTFKWNGSIEAPSGRKIAAATNASGIRVAGLNSNYTGVTFTVADEDIDSLIELLTVAKLATLERDDA